MVCDILRRLVERTTAQQASTETEAATALLQYAPSTGRVRVRRTRDAGSHRPQFRLHHRVHRRYRGIRYDLSERDDGRLVADGKWGSDVPIRAISTGAG